MAEGDRPKADGDILYASEFNTNADIAAKLWQPIAYNLWQNSYNGWSSKISSVNLTNIDYNTFGSNNMTINGNIFYDATNDLYAGPSEVVAGEFNTYDEFDDGSIDTNLWTVSTGGSGGSGSVSESGGNLNHSCSNSSTSGNRWAQIDSDNDVFTHGGTDWVFMEATHAYQYKNDASETAQVRVRIGSHYILNLTITATTTSSGSITWQMMRLGAFTYKRTDTGSGYGSWTLVTDDVSNGLLYLYTRCGRRNSGTACYTNMQTNYVRRNTLATAIASSTNYIESSAATSASTITNSTTVADQFIADGSSGTFKISADNGSNYEAQTEGELLYFANTGTQLKHKWLLKGAGYLAAYATKWNLV